MEWILCRMNLTRFIRCDTGKWTRWHKKMVKCILHEEPNIPPNKRSIQVHIFLIFHKNTCYGYSLEAPRCWGASNEYPQHLILWKKKKNQYFLFGIWCYAASLWTVRLNYLYQVDFRKQPAHDLTRLHIYTTWSEHEQFPYNGRQIVSCHMGEKHKIINWAVPCWKCVFTHMQTGKARSAGTSAQSDQGHHFPLTEPLDTTECMNIEQKPEWCFAHVCRPRWLSWMRRPTGDQEVGVQPPSRSATFFRGDWSWNIFYGHSLPSADSRRAVVSFWRKNVHNTG